MWYHGDYIFDPITKLGINNFDIEREEHHIFFKRTSRQFMSYGRNDGGNYKLFRPEQP